MDSVELEPILYGPTPVKTEKTVEHKGPENQIISGSWLLFDRLRNNQ